MSARAAFAARMPRARLIAQTLLLAFAFPLLACQAAPGAEYDLTDQRKPPLWRVTDPVGGGTAYLFGTVHMLPRGVNWRTPPLVRALAASDRLVKELAPGDAPPALTDTASGAFDEPVVPLADRLEATDYTRLRTLADDRSLDLPRLDGLESWAVALIVARAEDNYLRIERGLGVDAVLERRFADRKRPVIGLDTAREQFARFDALPDALQTRLLALALADAGNSEAMAQEYEAMVNAWLSGDLDRLARLPDSPFAEPGISEAILIEPNRKWARAIGAMLRQGQNPFVAVGAVHLAGKDSLVDLLAEQGLTVERIQ